MWSLPSQRIQWYLYWRFTMKRLVPLRTVSLRFRLFSVACQKRPANVLQQGCSLRMGGTITIRESLFSAGLRLSTTTFPRGGGPCTADLIRLSISCQGEKYNPYEKTRNRFVPYRRHAMVRPLPPSRHSDRATSGSPLTFRKAGRSLHRQAGASWSLTTRSRHSACRFW